MIPVRKLLPKSYLVIPDRIDTEKIIDLKSGGECVTGRVDILSTFKLGGPKTAVVDGRSKYVWPYPPPYDDFFVSARYDEASDGWRVAFWTTNANCGVIATAKRRYEAPADGYLPRAEVSQEEYLSPSFTLYLRTREPRVYAMMTPEGWTGQTPRETRGGPPGQRRFRFRLREVRVNPYGTREMELENVEYHLSGRLRREALTSLTVRREYPPAHDTGRLSAVASELTRLDRSLGGDYRGFRSLKLATDKKMKARSEAAEGNKEKEASLERDLREEYDSACRRRDELNGILEREFSSKRDGGQK